VLSLITGCWLRDLFEPEQRDMWMVKHGLTRVKSVARGEGIGTAIKIVSSRDGVPASTVILDEVTGNVKTIVNARRMMAIKTLVDVWKCIFILLRPRNTGSHLATLVPSCPDLRHLLAFGAGNQIEEHVKLHISAIPTLCTGVIVVWSINARAGALVGHLQPDFPQVVFFRRTHP
jgi:hypothetical protein